MEPFIFFESHIPNRHVTSSDPGIKWSGSSGRCLGTLRPQKSREVRLTAVPLKPGLHPIPSLKISDLFLRNDYKFEEIAFIYVKEPKKEHSDAKNPNPIPKAGLVSS